MPGILGIMRSEPFMPDASATLNRMAEPLRYSADQTVQHFERGRFVGAVVDYGPRFPFLKPAAAERDGVLLLMEGEVFPDAAEVPHELASNSPTIQRADYCLRLYLDNGPMFVRHLNGSFAIAVYDSRDQTLHLYTDRFLSRPLFFWHKNNEFAFASSIRTLLCCRDDIGREYDHIGVAEFIGLERAVSERTFFADIRKLPTAAHAVLSNGKFNIVRYFNFDPCAVTDLSSWQEAALKLVDLLKKGLEKRIADDCGFGLFLSGGIDSRLILALVPDSVTGLTFTNAGIVSKEHKLALKAAKTRGIRCIELPRKSDHTVLKAHASVDINDGLCGYEVCRCVSFFDRLVEAGIRATTSGMYFDETMKGCYTFEEETLKEFPYIFGTQLEMISPPECVRNRAIGRMLSGTGLGRKTHHLDLLSLALSDELKNALAIAKEHQIQKISEWVSAGGRIGDLVDRFPIANVGFLGGRTGFTRTNRTRLIDRSVFYDNELAEFAISIPYEWKRGSHLVRYALREVSPELAKIEDPRTRLPAGLCSPWDWIILNSRNILKRSSLYAKVVHPIRERRQNVHPFNQSAYHDINALLKFSPEYEKLVLNSVDRLPSELFDIERIKLLLKDDLSARKPRLGELFAPLVAFSLFDAKWGPKSDRLEVNCYLG